MKSPTVTVWKQGEEDPYEWKGPKPSSPAYIAVPSYVAHEIVSRVDAAVVTYPQLQPAREEMLKALFGVFADFGHLNCEILPQKSTESPSPQE